MNSNFNRLAAVFVLLVFSTIAVAQDGGGMWLLPTLDKINKVDLEQKGLQIPVPDLALNDGSLSEAVVQFGKGCTASFISSTGLLLTNYHCSYSAIQALDNAKRNMWIEGYWAKEYKEELAVPGLTVTVNKKIIDATAEVWDQFKTEPNQEELKGALTELEDRYRQRYAAPYKVLVRSYKNQRIITVYIQLEYSDVRLVGIAPKSVAKFGGETDNWMWPRHSGDFALFRVYAGAKGTPAKYSVQNQPLSPEKWLKVSDAGVQKNDFTMSMGFPMMSDRYSTSFQIVEKVSALNPPMIAARQRVLDIYSQEMGKSDRIRRLYQEKYAEMANYYKNAVGMNHWVDTLQLIPKKEAQEKVWLRAVPNDAKETEKRARLYESIKGRAGANRPYKRALTYYSECTGASQLLHFLSAFGNSYIGLSSKPKSSRSDLTINASLFYQKFDIAVDKAITKEILYLLSDSLTVSFQPELFVEKGLTSHVAIAKYVDKVYEQSLFGDSTKLLSWIKNPSSSIQEDPGFQLATAINKKQKEIYQRAIPEDYRIKGLINQYRESVEAEASDHWYPDADKTIRLSYGKIDDLRIGAETKLYSTTFDGLLEKSKLNNKDYFLHPKLQEIAKQGDFGGYAQDGKMPVCFIAEGDVTGGNSGSPMTNAKGELVGLVFDCNWESMTREFNFDKELNRVICVDIRYILLLIDQFSGSSRIKNELSIVHNR